MKDEDKTKEQLIKDLEKSRQLIAELEASNVNRELIEEELQIAEQNFHSSIDSSPLGICISSMDGNLLYANDSALHIFGCSNVEELKVKPLEERYTSNSYVDERKRQLSRKQGRTISPAEVSIIRNNGEIRHLWASRKAVVWNREVHFQLAYQDITELRRTEVQLREIMAGLAEAQRIAHLGSWELDLIKNELRWSDEIYRIFGLKPQKFETTYETFLNSIHPEDREFVEKSYRNSIRNGTTYDIVHRIVRPNGEIRFIQEQCEHIKDKQGKTIRSVGTILDITRRVVAEKAVRQSEEKLTTILENTSDVIFQVSPSGIIQYVSPKVEEIHGYRPEDLVGKHLKKTTPTNEILKALGAIKTVLSGKVITNFEINQKNAAGTIVATEINAAPVKVDGKIIAAQGVMRDITERKQAEELFRNLAASSPIGIYIVQNGRFKFSNPQFQMYTGYSQNELLRMDSLQIVTPEDRELVREMATKMLKGKRKEAYEYKAINKAGNTRWVLETVAPIQYQGKRATVGTYMDITDHKQAEEAIKRAAEEWRTTFDSITDFVSIHDKDFRFTRANKAFADILHMHPKQLIGKTCYQLVHGTDKPLKCCPHMTTLRTKMPATADCFEPNLGIHLEISTSPIVNEKGSVVAIVHVARDITERKRMEQQLIVADRLASIGELASGIAHELNNPLTSIIGFSELLLQQDVPNNAKNDLKIINREAQRTANVVRNLLIFARKHETSRQPININKALQTVLELRAYEQKVNNILVKTKLSRNLPEIEGDGFQLQQVFINIIINAEYFMTTANGKGTLTITTEKAGEAIRTTFSDDGPGIAPKDLSHLFDPFFTTKEVGKGTGLGLSISYGILAEHNGRIYAKSELGEGATFIVELPINSR